MPESQMHSFKTYSDYRKRTLSILQTTQDPCLLFRRDENELEGLVCTQADDTRWAGASNRHKEEENGSIELPNKLRSNIEIKLSRFNGIEIDNKPDDEELLMNQSNIYLNLKRENFPMNCLSMNFAVFEQNTLIWDFLQCFLPSYMWQYQRNIRKKIYE